LCESKFANEVQSWRQRRKPSLADVDRAGGCFPQIDEVEDSKLAHWRYPPFQLRRGTHVNDLFYLRLHQILRLQSHRHQTVLLLQNLQTQQTFLRGRRGSYHPCPRIHHLRNRENHRSCHLRPHRGRTVRAAAGLIERSGLRRPV